jgi:hypothetical protein
MRCHTGPESNKGSARCEPTISFGKRTRAGKPWQQRVVPMQQENERNYFPHPTPYAFSMYERRERAGPG